MPSDRVADLAEMYETLVLADTLTYRALVALYIDLVSVGGSLSDEDMQEVVNALKHEACTEPLMGLGWLYYQCGQKALDAQPEDDSDEATRNFNTVMLIFAINAIPGFPDNLEGQEGLFEKVHGAIQVSMEVAGPEIVDAAIADLEEILLESAEEELVTLCRERGMSDSEVATALDAIREAFDGQSSAGIRLN